MDSSVLGQQVAADDATTSDDFIINDLGDITPNESVTTSDNSIIGDIKAAEQPQSPAPFDFSSPSFQFNSPEEDASETLDYADASESAIPTITQTAEPIDKVKEDFVKIYTKEFDDTLQRATSAAQKILESIDTVIKEHVNDIAIPAEANEFLDKPPTNGKVQKFDDARAIVERILARANEAKQNSATAATEASRVYDEVQKFKSDTATQISQLNSKQ